jgi:hypothetical protein
MGDVVKLTAGRTRPAAALPKPRSCARCDEPIETARLQVMPTAKRCIACERGLERTVAHAVDVAGDYGVVIIKR